MAASVAILALSLNAAAPALAAEGGDIFADLTPLAAGDMEQMRGGFKVGGYDINIGVTVRTAIDGVVQVTSNFSIDRPGALQNLSTQITEATQTAVNAATDAAKIAVAAAEVATGLALAEAKKQVAEATASIPKATTVAMPPPPPPIDAPAVTTAKLPPGVMTSVTQDAADKITHTVALHSPQQADIPDPPGANGSQAGANGSQAGAMPQPQPQPPQALPGSLTQHASGAATAPPQTMPVSVPDVAEIIHSSGIDGHLSVINNSLNNVSIRQSVDVNLSVQNFHQVQSLSAVQRSMTAIARQIGVLSLRH